MVACPWQVLSRTTVFRGGPIDEIAVEAVRLPDGRIIDDYFTIRLTDYVLIYPEWDDGTVSMLWQYRHGLRRFCLGFPGGAIERGETPHDAARRELLEELGCEATQWFPLGAFTTNGNQGCNQAHLFRASGCRSVGAATSPDVEQPEVARFEVNRLAEEKGLLQQIGLASHVALLLMATHDRFRCG